ncbi:MAG: HAD family phosphatase [Candidatus Pacearchaeota archaeon]
MTKIKAVIFDIGGVLALHRTNSPNLHASISKRLYISVDQWFDAIDVTYARSVEGKISEKKVLDIFSKNIGVKKGKLKRIIIEEYRKEFIQNKKLYDFAFSLGKKGYKTAILSDQWHLSKRAVVPPKYIKKFDVVVISCDVGMRKPGMEIFRLTLKKLKLSANQTIFIDNQKWNIKPAKKLGMNTILFKNNKQFFREIKRYKL